MAISAVEQLVRRVHQRPVRFVVAVTGGGASAISALLTQPGASRTILEAVVPYAHEAMDAWLGTPPEFYCSPQTVRAMAMTAYRRGLAYAPETTMAGIACTASLATDRPKRGAHRIYLALQMADRTLFRTVRLSNDRRSRTQEEKIAQSMILNLVAEASGVEERLRVDLADSEQLESAGTSAPQSWQDLLSGRTQCVRCGPSTSAAGSPILFPGAFNPIHGGHRRMVQLAGQLLGGTVAYEISILNVDKPPLDFLELEQRLAQFTSGETVWLTRAPTFVEKAAIFPAATFVVGADTIERIADPRYYTDRDDAVARAIASLRSRGAQFLVFGRQTADGFKTLGDLHLPPALIELCQPVPAEAFREDISSTELRRQAAE